MKNFFFTFSVPNHFWLFFFFVHKAFVSFDKTESLYDLVAVIVFNLLGHIVILLQRDK